MIAEFKGPLVATRLQPHVGEQLKAMAAAEQCTLAEMVRRAIMREATRQLIQQEPAEAHQMSAPGAT